MQAVPVLASDAPSLSSTNPADASTVTSAELGDVSATFGTALDASSFMTLRDATDTYVAGASSVSADTLTFAPSEALTDAASPYTASFDAVADGGVDHATGSFSFSLDNVAPGSIVIDAPAADALVADPVAVTGATDEQAAISVAEGGSEIASGTSDAEGSFSIPLSLGSENGVTHTITVVATDAAGNASAEAVRTFTHDNVAPAAPVITSPADGTATSSTNITVSGTSDDGTVAVSDGADQIATTTATGGAWSVTIEDFEVGQHSLTAKTTDAAGNVGPASAAVNVEIDETAPPIPTLEFSDTLINAAEQTAIAVSGVTEPLASVDVAVDDENAGTAAVTASVVADNVGAFVTPDLDLSGLDDGALTATATATDQADNESLVGEAMASKDTVAPAAPAVVVDPAVINAAEQTEVTIGGSGEPGAGAAIALSDGVADVLANATVDEEGAFSVVVDSSTLADGALTATAALTDEAGNEGSATDAAALKDTLAPGAPAIDLPAADAILTSSSVTVTGSAEPGAAVEVAEGETSLGTTTADGSGAWSLAATVTGDGEHTIAATQTDTAGNPGSESALRSFVVNTSAPVLVSTTPADDTFVTSAADVVATYSESLSEGTFAVRNRHGTLVAGTTSVSGSAVRFAPFGGSLSELGSPYTAEVSATDLAESTSAPSSFGFVVDATAPGAPAITSPAVDSVSATKDVLVEGTAEAGSKVELFADGTSKGLVTAGENGAWSKTIGLAGGRHTLTATAKDAAGNVGATSSPVGFWIDTARPTVSITTGDNAPFGPLDSVVVNGDATDDVRVARVEVEVYDVRGVTAFDGNATLAEPAATTTTWSVELALAPGRYSVIVRSYDGRGLPSSSDSIKILSLTL